MTNQILKFILLGLLISIVVGCSEPRTGRISLGADPRDPAGCKATKPQNEIIVKFQFRNKTNPKKLRVYFWDDLVYDECTGTQTKYEYEPKVSRREPKFIDMSASYPHKVSLPAGFRFRLEKVTDCELDTVEVMYFLEFPIEPVAHKPNGSNCPSRELASYEIRG